MCHHASVGYLSLLLAGSLAAGTLPAPGPLLELTFGGGLANTGSLGGTARVEEYAAGEGPLPSPGVRGMGMGQLRPSRAGGPGETPAGGAVVYEHAGLNNLAVVTLALWFQPAGENSIARLLYFSNQWDLVLSGSTLGFSLRHGGADQRYAVPAGAAGGRAGEWTFVAVVHERAAGRAAVYQATASTSLRRVAEWTAIPVPDAADGPLQVGNLGRIRPFRGSFDSLRIYDRALSAAELGLLAAEVGPRLPLERATAGTPPPSGLFQRGDVVFSCRSQRSDALAAVTAFRPDRLLWHYTSAADFVAACRAAGVTTVQGAINSIAGASEPEAQARDLDGKPVIAPWMVAFDRVAPWYWGCNNRPRFLALSVERAGKALGFGVDWMQFDDWGMVVSAHGWSGACFCDDCMRLFRADLAVNVPPATRQELGLEPLDRFDYREFLRRHGITAAATYLARRAGLPTTPLFEAFQRRSVRRFFSDLRQAVDAAAGRRVPFSVNTTLHRPGQRDNFLVDGVDFLEGETSPLDLLNLVVPARVAEALGTWQVFSPIPSDVRTTRRAIATSYALGQPMLVPWDIYMGSDASGIKPRYFGTVAEYGDLFDFVRRSRPLLDGLDTCASAALVIDLDHPDAARSATACQRLLDAGVPFVIAPVGSSYYPAALRSERLEALQWILLACDPQALPEADRQALAALAETVPISQDRELDDRDLRACSRCRVWGPAGLVVLPRAPRDPARRLVVLHVLNHSGDDEVRWVSIILPTGTLGSPVAAARWHTPGQEVQPLEMETLAEGLRLFLPRLGLWGIVELELAPAPSP
jgi:hypothetical protein